MEQRKHLEQRIHPRYRFRYEIRLLWKEESVAGTLSDLSVRGCKVESKASVYVDMYLALQICLPGQEATLNVDQAVVRWLKEHEFGLEFISMRPEEKERLRDVVSTLETQPGH